MSWTLWEDTFKHLKMLFYYNTQRTGLLSRKRNTFRVNILIQRKAGPKKEE